MKHIFYLAFLGVAFPLSAFSLSEEGRQEAQFFTDFLETVYQQRAADTKAKNADNLSRWQELLDRQPDSAYLKRQFVAAAVAQNQVEAAAPYADFLEQSEKSAEDYRVYGAYLALKGDWKGAVEAYENALQTEEETSPLVEQYVVLVGQLPLEEAAEKLDKLAAQYPQIASDIYVETGRLFLKKHQLQRALEYFNKTLERDNDHLNAHLGRALVYEQAKQYFLMLHELEFLDKAGWGDAAIYKRMASVYLLVRDLDQAETYFLKVLQTDPADPDALYFLTALAENRKDYHSAFSYLTRSRDYKESPSKQIQAAFYAQKAGNSQEALRQLRVAYQNAPDNVEVAYFYALALQQDKQPKKAARVLKEAVTQNPQNEQLRLQYAFALEESKKYSEMEKQVKTILEQNPNQAAAQNLLAYSLAQRGQRLDEAQTLIARALAQDPNEYAFMDTQAWLWYKQGKTQEALALLQSIPAEVIDRNGEMAYHLGVLYHAQGREKEALSYLEKAKDTWPPAKKLYRQLTK